jgi:hypothetical protein
MMVSVIVFLPFSGMECCGIVAAFLSEIGSLVSKNIRFLPKASF